MINHIKNTGKKLKKRIMVSQIFIGIFILIFTNLDHNAHLVLQFFNYYSLVKYFLIALFIC